MAGQCGTVAGPSGTYSIVEQQITLLTNSAMTAFGQALSALNQLAAFKVAFRNPDVNFHLSPTSITPFQKAALPKAPDTAFHAPDDVADPSLLSINPIPQGQEPVFTSPEPSINLPPQPGALTAQRPGDPPTPSVITLPDEPTQVIPEVPTLNAYRLPVVAPIDLTGLRSAFATLWAQRPSFDFTNRLGDNYLSNFNALWPALLAKQTDYINGNTVNNQVVQLITEFLGGSIGIPAAVDAQAWSRDYAEVDRNIVKAEREAREGWAARGETMPAGVLDFRLAYARQEATRARQGVVRERMIKRTEWMIENYKAILQQGIVFLDMERKQFMAIVTLTETMAYHAFDVSERIIKVEIAIKELIRATWSTQASVFETWLKTELAELEKVRAELEVQQLVGKINSDLLAQYTARLDAVKVAYSLYRDKLEALNIILGQDKLRFDAFEAEVRAYTAEVGAWGEEWKGYDSAVQGELGKTNIFETLAKAFASRMQGYAIGQETNRKNEELKIDTNRLRLDLFSKKIDRFLGQLRSEAERLDVLIKTYQANTQLYDSANRSELGRVDSEVRAMELDTRQGEAMANVSLKQAEVAIQEMLKIAELLVHAQGEVARTSATLTGSFASAAHVGATISNSASDNTSCSTDYNYNIQQ